MKPLRLKVLVLATLTIGYAGFWALIYAAAPRSPSAQLVAIIHMAGLLLALCFGSLLLWLQAKRATMVS